MNEQKPQSFNFNFVWGRQAGEGCKLNSSCVLKCESRAQGILAEKYFYGWAHKNIP